MQIKTVFVALTAMTALLATDVSGPVLGYAHLGETLRPILGIPGASYFGAAIDTGELAIAAVSSAGGYAVAFTPDHRRMHIVPVGPRRLAQPFLLLGDASAVHSVVLSASGTSLAVVRDDHNQIDIFTGLPSTPRKLRTLSLLASPAIVAVSDDGDVVAVGDKTLLFVYERDEARQIGAVDLRYICFRPGNRSFVYIDGDLVIAVSGATTRVVAAAPDGVVDARSVVPSRDGRTVFILNAGAKELLIAGDGASQRFDLPCAASDLEWLGISDLRLSCVSSGRVHLIDVSERGPRTFFIPEPVE